MAAGEYVSVSSQADTEKADLTRETEELASKPESELAELTAIYVGRGLSEPLAAQVAQELTAKDALGAHTRDELGMSDGTRARPLQAAIASAAAFVAGAAPPLLLVIFVPLASVSMAVSGVTLVLLIILGGLAAQLGGAPLLPGAMRVAFWGVMAMACTALVGKVFGTVA